MISRKKDRKYMETAIEEMRKSKSEHKNKFDPIVGAVLVGSNGTELGKAHRGNLRVGDHAEYTLIERFLADKNLKDTILYVTLEPCTTRQHPKKPCAERIVSARIKRVIIGTTDPNPEIQGKGITHLLENNVEVDFFDIDLVKQIREDNRNFIEQYDQLKRTSHEINEKYEGSSEKENEPVLTASVEDFSLEMINEYLSARNKSYKIPSSELWHFFYKNDFVTTKSSKDHYIPTVSGLLLFGENPEDFLVQSKIKMEAHHGEKVITSDIGGSLLLLPDKIKEFLTKNMRFFTEISGFKRDEIPEYPWGALREAVVNAIVHRDYNQGARVMIQMIPGKIIIKSPGLPLNPLSIEKIRTYNAPPYSRNPRIAESFYYMKLMEERGWGLSRMRDILIDHGLQPPEFNYKSGYFVVTFFGHEHMSRVFEIVPDLIAKLNKRQKRILDYIRKREKITSIDCAKKFKISKKTAIKDLNMLIQYGIVQRKGIGPSTHYVLIEA